MAKQVVRYLLEGNGTIPIFVEDGGYWMVGNELVGRSVDEDARHLPSTVVRMAKADLTARLAAMTFKDENGDPLDDAAKAVLLEAWLAQIGMSDLA